MTKGRFALAVIMALALVISASTVALADRPELLKIDVCHKDGRSGNYSLVNVNINSTDDADGLNGHGDHPDDSWAPFTYGGVDYLGQGNFPGPCGEPEPTATPLPTDIPTQEPTDEPTSTEEPSATPTDEPTIEPTPTNVGTDPTPTEPVPTEGPGPTDTPVVPEPTPDCEEPCGWIFLLIGPDGQQAWFASFSPRPDGGWYLPNAQSQLRCLGWVAVSSPDGRPLYGNEDLTHCDGGSCLPGTSQ